MESGNRFTGERTHRGRAIRQLDRQPSAPWNVLPHGFQTSRAPLVSAKSGIQARTRQQPSRQALADELMSANAELRRRLALCQRFRREGFDDPTYADMVGELREEIALPIVEQAIADERIDFAGAATLYCIEAYRRVRRISVRRSRWERLLHHEVLLLLASVSVQRALNFLLEDPYAASLGRSEYWS